MPSPVVVSNMTRFKPPPLPSSALNGSNARRTSSAGISHGTTFVPRQRRRSFAGRTTRPGPSCRAPLESVIDGKTVLLHMDACRHGGMTELEEPELTDGQGRALSTTTHSGATRAMRSARLSQCYPRLGTGTRIDWQTKQEHPFRKMRLKRFRMRNSRSKLCR